MDVALRKLAPEHLALHVRWRNASSQWFTPQPAWTQEGQRAWFEGAYLDDPGYHVYTVMAGGDPAGALGFRPRTREVGPVLLGEERLRRRGIMSRALPVLYEAFGPGRYWLRVARGNEAAIALYEKCGYRAIPARWLPHAGAVPGGQLTMGRFVAGDEL